MTTIKYSAHKSYLHKQEFSNNHFSVKLYIWVFKYFHADTIHIEYFVILFARCILQEADSWDINGI